MLDIDKLDKQFDEILSSFSEEKIQQWLDFAEEKLNELSKILNNSNRFCKGYWVNKGYNENESKNEISKIQSENSKKVKNRFKVSKENLKLNGYSDKEIKEILLTPVNIKFWVNKGYSENEAIGIISKHQSFASKHVDYEKKLLPSSIKYWTNKGYSEKEAKIKVFERQSTFSKKICIQKYGKVEGLKRFTERQNKWRNSLTKNGNLKMGYSKISQILFYEILNKYDVDERKDIMFATHNKEFKLNKCKSEGGVWLYDFTDTKLKKIIEYNGDQYHGNPKKYLAEDYPHPFRKNITAKEMWDKDKRKLNIANKEGFEVLVIWDSEYRWGNKNKIINKCIKFLNE